MKRNAKRLLALLLVLTLCVGLFPGVAFAEGEEPTEDPAPVGDGVLDVPADGDEDDGGPSEPPAPTEEPEDPVQPEAGEDEPLQPAEPAAPPEGEPEDAPDALPDEAEPNDDPAPDACGDNLTWTLENGTLAISGTGDMWDWVWGDGVSFSPWYSQRRSVTNLILPEGLTSIGSGAFTGFDRLTNITIPAGVTGIGDVAFRGCWGLTSITIPEGVTSIGFEAFAFTGAVTVTIPESVTSIGESVFRYCESLTDIYYGGTVSQWNAFGVLLDRYQTTVHCRDGEILPTDKSRCGDNLTWTLENGTLTISGTGDMWDFEYDTMPWYEQSGSILAVVIEPGVTSVGSEAFRSSSALTDIMIPESVTSIGDWAFYDCSSLTSITIPESVTSIGNYAFYDCTSLTSITIPESVTTIGSYVFSYCSSLTDVYYGGTISQWNALGDVCDRYQTTVHCRDGEILPVEKNRCGDNLTWTLDDNGTLTISGTGDMWDFEYNTMPWYDQRGSIREAVLEPGVTSIGNSAFDECSALTSATIPESVTSIGAGAFNNCDSLTNVTIPEGVTSIEYAAFAGCSALTSVTIPESVTSIGDWAFRWCKNLTNITIPAGVTTIGTLAFAYCSSLTSITIPEGVTTIGTFAFCNCSRLTSILFTGNAPVIGDNAFEGVTATAYYPYGDATWTEDVRQNYDGPMYGGSITWVAAAPANAVASGSCGASARWFLTDKGALTVYGSGAMADYASAAEQPWAEVRAKITRVVIEKGVTAVGENAFAECGKLERVTLPEGLERIGSRAFLSCGRLEACKLPAGLRSIGDSAFQYNYRLASLPLPASLTGLGSYAFAGCPLTAFSLPAGITEIPEGAFEDTDFASITIPGTVMRVGERAFHSCNCLKTLVIADGVAELGDRAFNDCWSMTSVKFGTTLRVIGDNAFQASALTSVTLPERLESLGYEAFTGCWKLKKVSFAPGVQYVGSRAFSGCPVLAEVRFFGDAPEFGINTFLQVTAKAYYVKRAAGWTPDVLQNYGGKLTWIPTLADGSLIATKSVQILDEGGENQAGKTVSLDLNGPGALTLRAAIVPEEASQSVKWTVSDTKHSYCTWTVNDDGSLTLTPSGTGKTGSVTVTATAQDGSKKAAKVTVKLVRLAHEINILGEDSRVIYGGGKLTFKTDIAADKTLTDKRVTWSVDDKAYASVNASGVLSTKAVTEPTAVTVTATVTATGASDSVTVTICPKVTALSFDGDTEIVKNAASFDLYGSRASVTFAASASPANAYQGVNWTVSDAKHTYCDWTVNDDGSITLTPSGTGKTGSVTITATAQDGTKKAAKLTLKFGKFAQSLHIDESYPTELRAGATVTFKTDIAADKTLTDKRVTWTIDDTTYATLNASGVLTAKKTVTEPVTVTVTAAATANPAAADTATVTIYPAVTAAQILRGGAALAKGEIVDLNLDGEPSVQLTGATLPANAIQRGTWKSSAPKVAAVDETGLVTGLKAGTATVTFTAADGSGKNTTVKIRVGKWTERITLGEHAESLVSGKTMTVKATPLTADGLTPTVKALTWTSSDPTAATVSAGKVTAKTVYRITEVTITAAATDGSGVSASFTVQIVPKTAEGLLLMQGAALVNGKTLTVSLAEAQDLDLEALLYTTATDSTAPAAGTWKSSAAGVAQVDANGHVTLLKAGTAKITVTQGKLTATVTIKVTK